MVEFREAFPGADFYVFDCAPMRASLSREACADNWRNRRCLSCDGCPIGAEHAGQKPRPATTTACVRCGRTGQRLLHKSLCICCWNRAREVMIGRNGKGAKPLKWSISLRMVYGLVRIARTDYLAAYHRSDGGKPHLVHLPCLPVLSEIEPGAYWLEVIAQGTDEATEMVKRLIPAAIVEDTEAGPTFARTGS